MRSPHIAHALCVCLLGTTVGAFTSCSPDDAHQSPASHASPPPGVSVPTAAPHARLTHADELATRPHPVSPYASLPLLQHLAPSLLVRLKAEAASLLTGRSQPDTLDTLTLPPTMLHLAPQFAHIEFDGDVLFVNLQLSGGFHHAGLLVLPADPPVLYTPPISRGWQLTGLQRWLFFYEE